MLFLHDEQSPRGGGSHITFFRYKFYLELMTKAKSTQRPKHGQTSGALRMGSSKRTIGRKNRRFRPYDNNSMNNRTVIAPVAMATGASYPSARATKSRSKSITNRELVGTLNGNVNLTVLTFPINPGLANTFPWLSSQAVNWQQYRFRKLCFHFITRVGSNTAGTMILSPDYNPIDPVPNTEQVAMDTQDAVENVPWRDFSCFLDVGAMHEIGPRKTVRTQNVAGDLAAFDCGNLHVCAVGMADGSAVGKLWVEYEIDFFVPATVSLLTAPSTVSGVTIVAPQIIPNGVQTRIDWTQILFDPLGVFQEGVPRDAFHFPKGNYFVMLKSTFIDTSAESFGVELHLDDQLGPISTAFDSPGIAFGAVQTRAVTVFGAHYSDGEGGLIASVICRGAAGNLSLINSPHTQMFVWLI